MARHRLCILVCYCGSSWISSIRIFMSRHLYLYFAVTLKSFRVYNLALTVKTETDSFAKIVDPDKTYFGLDLRLASLLVTVEIFTF